MFVYCWFQSLLKISVFVELYDKIVLIFTV